MGQTADMAWAEKLPSGKYRGLYRDAAGIKRSVGTFSHKARAERAAAAKEDQARKSMRRDPEAYRRPWGEWVTEDWWPNRVVAPSTRRQDESRLRNHLEPRWADVPIGSITRQDVKAWLAGLRRTLGPESVKRCLHLFSASLVAALDAEIIDANPAARIALGGGAPAQERYLTREEYAAIREQLPTTGDQLLADLLVNTGLRWGELAGLHWSRVDLDRGLLRVVETYDEGDGRMTAYPKGKKVRDVPLTPELVEALKVLPRGNSCGVEHMTGRCASGLVFTTDEGRPLRNSNWSYRVWVPTVSHADVGHVRIHDLRHTFASWLLQAGVPLAEVGRLLGHVSPQTTQRYAHLAETDFDAVLSALAAPRKSHMRLVKA